MSVRERIVERAGEWLETATGLTITDKEDLTGLQESLGQYQELASEAEDLAFWAMRGQTSMSGDPRPERRILRAKEARRAFTNDPIAGTEALHYANFALGRGVGLPQAKEPKVQTVLDEAWEANEEALTGIDALTAISNELRSGANVYPLFFRKNGRVRTSFLNADDVIAIRSADDDRHRPLYYVTRVVKRTWDYSIHGWTVDLAAASDPKRNTKYFAHFRNVDLEAKDDSITASAPPPPDMLGEGTVYHVRINRLLEQGFGTPPWQRQLRFFAAMNRLVEARVSMQLAASSIIAKRVVKGGSTEVQRAASSVLNQLGEIGAGRPDRPQAKRPPRPGSTDIENESDRLEAINLNSGAGNAQTDIGVVRSAAIAPSCFGPNWFGAGDQTSLASAACHDEQTETLTEEGFLGYEELHRRDAEGTMPRVAGFNKGTGALEYHEPLRPMLQYDYNGEMVAFKNRRTDIMVTPDHRMWVRISDGSWGMKQAQEITRRHDQLRAAPLVGGRRIETVTIPAYTYDFARGLQGTWTAEQADRVREMASEMVFSRSESRRGYCECGCGAKTTIAYRNVRKNGEQVWTKDEPLRYLSGHNSRARKRRWSNKDIAEKTGLSKPLVAHILTGYVKKTYAASAPPQQPEVDVNADAFLYWLGWYIAEGSDAEVAQMLDGPWQAKLREACLALGVPGRERVTKMGQKSLWRWTPSATKQWQTFLDTECGRGYAEKRVPRWVFDLCPEQQMLVLRGLMEGDGDTFGTSEWETCGSSSLRVDNEGLLDDAQRLALHCGFRADMVRKKPDPGASSSSPAEWYLSLVATAEDTALRGCNGARATLPGGERLNYRGRVYCFTLPTDTMITRRNGRVAFHGNTAELPASQSIGAFQEVIERLLRAFSDVVIEEAVRSGRLGGNVKDDDDSGPALNELCLCEAADMAVAQKRTGLDLTYSFEMPYPGRRNLPDVQAAFTSLLEIAPEGENDPLTRLAYRLLLTHGFQMPNASDLADEIADAQKKVLAEQQAQQMALMQSQLPLGGGGSALPDGTSPGDGSPDTVNRDRVDTSRPVYGEKRQASSSKGEMGSSYESLVEEYFPEGRQEDVEALARGIALLLGGGTSRVAVDAASRLNGHGGS